MKKSRFSGLCPQAGRAGDIRAGCPAVSWAFLIPRSICGVRSTAEFPLQLKNGAVCAGD